MAQDVLSVIISSLIDKKNFVLDLRLADELVVIPQRGSITQKLIKISLPFGNFDFDQFLRYSSEMWWSPQFPPRALNLMQNQNFNLKKIL